MPVECPEHASGMIFQGHETFGNVHVLFFECLLTEGKWALVFADEGDHTVTRWVQRADFDVHRAADAIGVLLEG